MTSIPILNVNVRVGPPASPQPWPPRCEALPPRMRYSRASWTCSGGGAAAVPGPAAPRQVRLLGGGLFRPTW
jgi:hypothetical protein